MYERLLLSEYAVADLTILNANVYYELGVRHAARPATTIMTMADQTGLPFDVTGLRAFTYSLDADGKPSDASGASNLLGERLRSCIARDLVDSPLYQLVDALQPPPIDRERTDVFRERAAYSADTKLDFAHFWNFLLKSTAYGLASFGANPLKCLSVFSKCAKSS